MKQSLNKLKHKYQMKNLSLQLTEISLGWITKITNWNN